MKALVIANLHVVFIIECSICLDSFKDRVTTLCGHDFCRGCIEKWLSSHSSCPVCLKVLQPLRGNQPPGGTMICAVRAYNYMYVSEKIIQGLTKQKSPASKFCCWFIHFEGLNFNGYLVLNLYQFSHLRNSMMVFVCCRSIPKHYLATTKLV